jgi:integrase
VPDLVTFMLGSGLRIGETCAVRATDLDLEACPLTVVSTVTRDPLRGLCLQGQTRTDASRHTIALPPQPVNRGVAGARQRGAGEARPPVLLQLT